MKSNMKQSKSGGILVMVMLTMLIFSILAVGLFKLQETNAVEAAYARQSREAFWLAEAGLQTALNHINWSPDYRSSPNDLEKDYGTGKSYSIPAPSVEPDLLSPLGAQLYTIESIGYVGGLNRRIQQVVSVAPGIKSEIDIDDGRLFMKSETDVDGSVLLRGDATIYTGNNETVVIGDFLYAEDDQISGNGTYTQAPAPPGEGPVLDTTKYTDLINPIFYNISAPTVNVKSTTSIAVDTTYTNSMLFGAPVTVSSGVNSIVCEGNLAFKQEVVFSDPVTIKVGGDLSFGTKFSLPPGSQVYAKGTINISGSSTLGDGVQIVSGENVELGNQMNIGGGAIIYANQDLTIAAGGANTIDSSGLGIALLAHNDLSIASAMLPFKGVIYADGVMTLAANMDIYGHIIGKGDITFSSNIDVHKDPSLVDWDLTGIGITPNDVILTKQTWQELSPILL